MAASLVKQPFLWVIISFMGRGCYLFERFLEAALAFFLRFTLETITFFSENV